MSTQTAQNIAPSDEAHPVAETTQDGVRWLTLNRPDRLNAWTGAMEKTLRACVGAAVDDDAVRVIVITGAGRGFCAGADMDNLQEISPDAGQKGARAEANKAFGETPWKAAEPGPDMVDDYLGRFGYLFRTPKPVIAAINGPAAGIGLVMALFCDLRFMAEGTILTSSFARRGLVAEHGIGWVLPRLVGPSHALDILFSARKVPADEALRMGLVNRVFGADVFADNVRDYARMLAHEVSPRSMAVMKAQTYKALMQDFNPSVVVADEEMGKSFATEDFHEGVAHFVEKRTPHFTGK